MNKEEFAKNVAARCGISVKEAKICVDGVLDELTDALKKKEPVSFIGWGNFSVKHRDEKIGRNPATGEEMTIPAKNAVSFKAGKKLEEAING